MASNYYDCLPESARERLHEKIDGASHGVPKQLGRIAKNMDEWEGGVADALDLTRAEVAAIKHDYKDKLALQTRAALEIWWDRNGPDATYHNLIQVFIKAEKFNFADTVCEILKEPPELQQATSQEKNYGEAEKAVLSKNEDNIRNLFADLLTQVCSSLVKLPVDMDDFRLFVAGLFPGILDHVSPSASVSDFFAYITNKKLWTFDHFTPVENIINKYLRDDSQVEQLIVNYEKELAGFYTTTSLVAYIALCEDRTAHPDDSLDLSYDQEYYQKLSLKLNVRVTDKTLKYTDDLWRRIAKFFMLPSLSALLDIVVSGSLIITWYIPRYTAAMIKKNASGASAETEKFFRKNYIIEIKLNDEVIYYDVKMCLLKACEEGDSEKAVVELLHQVPDFNFSQYDNTPLVRASKSGHTNLVKTLLHTDGVNIEEQDKDGWTALMFASTRGRTSVVKLLLSSGADVNAANKDGQTALMYASELERTDVVKLLINYDANVNAIDNIRKTALMHACDNESTDIMELLINRGANVNVANNNRWTALMYASENGRTDLVNLLINHGANVDASDDNGYTALIEASYNNHFPVVEVLLQYQANVNLSSKHGFTALMFASRNGHIAVVKKLLGGGADPNIAEEEKHWTAMFFVCDKTTYRGANEDRFEIVRLLIDHNADVDIRDKSGVSANDVALTHGFQEISDLINQHSRSIQQTTTNEETQKRVRTAGDYFRALLDFFLPEQAKKGESHYREGDSTKPKSRLRSLFQIRRRMQNVPTDPTH